MAPRVYLNPSDDKPASSTGVAAVAAVVVVVAFTVLWVAFVSLYSVIPALLVILVIVIAWRIRGLLRPALGRDIQAMQLARLRERIPEAIEIGHVLLKRRLLPFVHAQVVAVLGECAEVDGDFVEAARLFTRAEGTLRASRMHAVARAQQLAVVAARRAFAHAACGEIDRAEATLRAAEVSDGVPLAGPLASRAALLILARRGLKQQVTERLAADAKLLRNALAFRDRALVAVIAAHAASRALPPGAVEPTLAQWIGSAFPESKALLGVA